MRHPSELPAALRRGAFAVSASGAPGATRRRTRAADLSAPFFGARSPGSRPIDQIGLARAFAPLLRPGEAFSHLTAAAIHGLRTPSARAGRAIHLTTFDGGRPIRRAGVIGHRGFAECGRAEATGLRVTDPVETWLHLAATLDVDDLVVMGDGLLRRKHPFAAREELRIAFGSHRRIVGANRVRAALELVRPGTDSARETMTRLLLVRAGLPEPVHNLPIRDELGRVIAHGDLVWPDGRVIVEYEGDHHRTDQWQFSIDIDRIGRLQALGWHVIRVDAVLLARPRVLVDRVRRALARS